MSNIEYPKPHDYPHISPFRFWCQKVLPLVYDDSLSYYELLCKVVEQLNKTAKDLNSMGEDITTLYNFVNNYFKNLDVQTEINNKLDEMAQNGKLTALLEPIIPPIITDWLTEHVEPTSPVVDSTLTIRNAAADAYIAGYGVLPFLTGQIDENTDFDANNCEQNRIYRFVNAVKATNLPRGNTGTLFYFSGDISNRDKTTHNFSTQVYYDYRSENYYIRECYSNSWTNWTICTPTAICRALGNDSEITDANNAPSNSLLALFDIDVLNVPSNFGTLMTLSPLNYGKEITASNNYTIQIFMDSKNVMYYRSYFNKKWTEWVRLVVPNEFKILRTMGHTSTLTDANNAQPNTIYAIYGVEVSNLPEQYGTLITFAGQTYGEEATASNNYTSQFFIGYKSGLYSRGYFAGNWTEWVHHSKSSDKISFYGKKVVLGGDSITHGVGGSDFAQNGETIITTSYRTYKRNPDGYCWANLFANLLTTQYSCTVINNACTGTTSTFWKNHIAELVPSDADIFILTIGTNDRNNTQPLTAKTTLNTNLTNIKNYCERNGITFIVFSPIPASETNENNGEHPTHCWQINEFIKETCNYNGILYHDLYNECYKFYFNKGENIGTYVDGLHPNDLMYYNMYFMYCWMLDVSPIIPVISKPE